MSLLDSKNIYICRRQAHGLLAALSGSLKAKDGRRPGRGGDDRVRASTRPSFESCIYNNVIASNHNAAQSARHIALRSGCGIDNVGADHPPVCAAADSKTIVGAVKKTIRFDEHQVVHTGGMEQIDGFFFLTRPVFRLLLLGGRAATIIPTVFPFALGPSDHPSTRMYCPSDRPRRRRCGPVVFGGGPMMMMMPHDDCFIITKQHGLWRATETSKTWLVRRSRQRRRRLATMDD
jgi:hypothetical protein